MRSMVIAILAAFALPLVAFSQTNEWETLGDNALKRNPERAVKLYAKSLLTDGATVMSLQSNKDQEPYIVAMERVLDKLPWASADPNEFLRLMKALKPVLKKEFKGKERKERVKLLISKYKLLKHDDDTDEFEGSDHYAVPVVEIETTAIDIADIPVIDIGAVEMVYVGTETTDIEWTTVSATTIFVVSPNMTAIPASVIAIVKVPTISIDGWVAVYDLAFGIMGTDGLFVPHSNSPLGFKYRALLAKLEAYGPERRLSPVLLAEWKEYWSELRTALDRRSGYYRRIPNR